MYNVRMCSHLHFLIQIFVLSKTVRTKLIGVKLTDLDALIPINLVSTVLESSKIWTKKCRCEHTLSYQTYYAKGAGRSQGL